MKQYDLLARNRKERAGQTTFPRFFFGGEDMEAIGGHGKVTVGSQCRSPAPAWRFSLARFAPKSCPFFDVPATYSISQNIILCCYNYFPRVIKNERRGLPLAHAMVPTTGHTRTRAGLGVRRGTQGHFFRLFRKTPLSGTTPKNELCQSCCFKLELLPQEGR